MDTETLRRSIRREFAIAVVLTAVALGLGTWIARPTGGVDGRSLAAAVTMREATAALAVHRETYGPPLDPEDVNRTGLIGSFFTPLTTTIGTLEAKRTTTNPNLAAAVVDLLLDAGLKAGDAIAIGASGSFPAVLLAVLCAADALDLDVGLIVSFGASQWGANLVDFTWLAMQNVLIDAALLPAEYRADAASLGGADDVGREFEPGIRAELRAQIEAGGAQLLEEPDLEANVAQRIDTYTRAVDGQPIAAFVNIGGAWANVGPDSVSLSLHPGLLTDMEIPATEERGTLFAFADMGTPVLHFLQIAELAAQLGLAWDPSPLPEPGVANGDPRNDAANTLAALYLTATVIWLISVRVRMKRES